MFSFRWPYFPLVIVFSVQLNDCLQHWNLFIFYIFFYVIFDLHECDYNSDLHCSFQSLIPWHPLPMLSAQTKTNWIQIVCLSRKEMNNYHTINDCLQTNAHAIHLLMHKIEILSDCEKLFTYKHEIDLNSAMGSWWLWLCKFKWTNDELIFKIQMDSKSKYAELLICSISMYFQSKMHLFRFFHAFSGVRFTWWLTGCYLNDQHINTMAEMCTFLLDSTKYNVKCFAVRVNVH